MEKQLLKHQIEGLEFLRDKNSAGVFYEMGCVDGASILQINRAGRGFKTTLKDLFYKFNGGISNYHKWDLSIPTYTKSLCTGILKLNKIKEVLFKGSQTTLKIKLNSGKIINVTKDHEIATPNGWERADSLRLYDIVLTNGSRRFGTENSNYKRGWHLDKDGYVIASGFYGHHLANKKGNVRQHILVAEEKLKRKLKKGEIVHHLNGIKNDNRAENLEVMTKKQHAIHHGKENGFLKFNKNKNKHGEEIIFIPKMDCITSISPGGKKDVFDVVMEDPARNFVANGIIVHNCGKTLITLEHIERLRCGDYVPPLPCLIVCPLSAVSVWEREIKKFGFPFTTANLTGTRKDRIELLREPADIYIINYEGTRIIPLHLLEKGFNTMIADECHRLSDSKSQQTRIVTELSKRIPRKYLLTGTPVKNSPEDIWTQFNIIDPAILGNFFSFRARYIEMKKIQIRLKGTLKTIQKAHKFKNLKELSEKLKNHSIRRTKAECLDLPEKIYKIIPCHMTSTQKSHYQNLKHSLATTLAETGQLRMKNASALMQKLRQVCQGFVYDDAQVPRYFDSAKLNVLKDLLEDLSNEKVLIFTWFKADLDLLAKEIGKSRRVILFGGTSKERQAGELDFQESTDSPVFLTNIETGKESITLTACHHVVYYSNTWSYSTRKQSEDRCHRIGQHNDVIYYDLVCHGTVDELVADTLQMKEELADKITGDTIRLAEMIVSQN